MQQKKKKKTKYTYRKFMKSHYEKGQQILFEMSLLSKFFFPFVCLRMWIEFRINEMGNGTKKIKGTQRKKKKKKRRLHRFNWNI